MALVLVATPSGAATRVNWPQFRFDQNRTGFQPFETILNTTNVPTLQLKWQAQLGALVDYSSPAVVNGTIFVGSQDGRLYAFDAATCALRWKRFTGGG